MMYILIQFLIIVNMKNNFYHEKFKQKTSTMQVKKKRSNTIQTSFKYQQPNQYKKSAIQKNKHFKTEYHDQFQINPIKQIKKLINKRNQNLSRLVCPAENNTKQKKKFRYNSVLEAYKEKISKIKQEIQLQNVKLFQKISIKPLKIAKSLKIDHPFQQLLLNKSKKKVNSNKKRLHNSIQWTSAKHQQQQPQNWENNQQKFDLTEQQRNIFGNRFPKGFQKKQLLGKGGFSLVWLAHHIENNKLFAIKQIITKNQHQTHIKQISFISNFYAIGGIPRSEFIDHPGLKNLVKMYSYEINAKDTWIFYQRGGQSLGKCLYDLCHDQHLGEKVYKIYNKPLYYQIIKNPDILNKIIIELCKVIQLISSLMIVHSDIKTQNILIKHQQGHITDIKLIDYGSSFLFSDISQFSMATPQYMPYQLLNYIQYQNQNQYDQILLQKVKEYKNPWVIDIWSLGCVILQIIVGLPLWINVPVMVSQYGKSEKKIGLFAVKDREFSKIISKQLEVIRNLEFYINQYNSYGIKISAKLLKALKGMIALEPDQRLSPRQIIQILSKS